MNIPQDVKETITKCLLASIKRIEKSMPDPNYRDPYLTMSKEDEFEVRDIARAKRDECIIKISKREKALKFLEQK